MKIKIISFNIRCNDDPDGHSIPERAPRLSVATNSLNPDIIGLQEWRPAWEEHILSCFVDKYEIFNKFRSQDDKESCPLLWRKDKFSSILPL